jgi:hypothetical protein
MSTSSSHARESKRSCVPRACARTSSSPCGTDRPRYLAFNARTDGCVASTPLTHLLFVLLLLQVLPTNPFTAEWKPITEELLAEEAAKEEETIM